MKRFLSFFMVMLFMLCSTFCNTPIFAVKLSKDDVVKTESHVVLKENQNFIDAGGIKNVINHPFKILFRAGGWGILGYLSSIILPIPQTFCFLLGISCGGVSKVLELYSEGCSVK